jgi:hypothetical protein
MTSLLTATAILAILCGSSVVGFGLRQVLDERHFTRETLDSMRIVISMLITFAALVLGLLTSSVKARLDGETDVLRSYGIHLIELDQRMREYGPDMDAARKLLRTYTAAAIYDTWPQEARPSGSYPTGLHRPGDTSVESSSLGDMLDRVSRITESVNPPDGFHTVVSQAMRTRMMETLDTRWKLIEDAHSTISWPFLTVMLFWLVIVFAMFGMSAPRNRIMYATILFCALSVASALFLILDYDSPYTGLLALPSQPMRDALAHMDLPG